MESTVGEKKHEEKLCVVCGGLWVLVWVLLLETFWGWRNNIWCRCLMRESDGGGVVVCRCCIREGCRRGS